MMSSLVMFFRRLLPGALLLLVLAAVPARAQLAAAPFSSEAELVRIHNGRLYLWVESPVTINGDFAIEVSLGERHLLSCPVRGSLAEVVISDSLSDSLLQSFRDLNGVSYSVHFHAENLRPDTLQIGLPATFSGRLPEEYAELHDELGPRKFRNYDSLDEAEIDLALGQIQLLLLPETEIETRLEQRHSIFGSPVLVEWYLLLDLPDDDLLPAALSYCLKGLLVESSADSLISAIILPRHADQYFPRNPANAGLLYRQMQDSLTRRDCYFKTLALFPGLAGRVSRAVSDRGGSLRINNDRPLMSIQLGCLPIVDQVQQSDYLRAVTQVYSQARAAGFSWAGLNTIEGSDDSLQARQQLSRMLSANLRLIPLGRSRLMIVAGQEAHHIRHHDAPLSLDDFYLVVEK